MNDILHDAKKNFFNLFYRKTEKSFDFSWDSNPSRPGDSQLSFPLDHIALDIMLVIFININIHIYAIIMRINKSQRSSFLYFFLFLENIQIVWWFWSDCFVFVFGDTVWLEKKSKKNSKRAKIAYRCIFILIKSLAWYPKLCGLDERIAEYHPIGPGSNPRRGQNLFLFFYKIN